MRNLSLGTLDPLRGGSIPPGAFYFPAPREKGRKAYYEPRKDRKCTF